MSSLLSDPWIATQVEAAVAPYVGRLPASEIAWMRERLAETLDSDPRAAELLRRAHPREVDESGDIAVGDARDAVRATQTGGGKR